MTDEEKQEYANFQQEFSKMLESDEFKQQVAEVENKMKSDPKFRKEVEDFNKEFVNSLAKLGEEINQKTSATAAA